jgi:hypothetical protein
MKRLTLIGFFVFLFAHFCSSPAFSQGDSTLLGKWELIPDQSTDIDHFSNLTIEFQQKGNQLTILQTWVSRRSFRDSLVLTPRAAPVEVPVKSWVFPGNVFMGVRMVEGEKRQELVLQFLVIPQRCRAVVLGLDDLLCVHCFFFRSSHAPPQNECWTMSYTTIQSDPERHRPFCGGVEAPMTKDMVACSIAVARSF